MLKCHKLLFIGLLAGCGFDQSVEGTSGDGSDYEDALASSNISSVAKMDLGSSWASNFVGNSSGVVFSHRGHLMQSQVSSQGMEKITEGGDNGPGVARVYGGEGSTIFASIGHRSNEVMQSADLSSEPNATLVGYSSLEGMRDTVQIGENLFVIHNSGINISTAQISMASTTDRIFEPIPADIDLSKIHPTTVVGINGYDSSSQVSMLRFGSRLAVFTRASSAERSNSLDSLTIDANGDRSNSFSVHILSSEGNRVKSITGVGLGYVLVAGRSLVMYRASNSLKDFKIISRDGSLVTVDALLSQQDIYTLGLAVYANSTIYFTGWDTEKSFLYSMPTSGSRVDKIAEFAGASGRGRISLASVGSDIIANFMAYTDLGFGSVVLKIDTSRSTNNVTDVSRAFHDGNGAIRNMTAVGNKLVAFVDGGIDDRKLVLFDPSSNQAEVVDSHRSLYLTSSNTTTINFRSKGLHITPAGSESFYYTSTKVGGGYEITKVDLIHPPQPFSQRRAELLFPAGQVETFAPRLHWRPVLDAESYHVWISERDTPSRAIFQATTENTWFDLAPGTLEAGVAYSWWVRPETSAQKGQWSVPLNFELDGLYASEAQATSEYSSDWVANNALGAPGDSTVRDQWVGGSAWCKATQDGDDAIILDFDSRENSSLQEVVIFFAGDASTYDISLVEALAPSGSDSWFPVWMSNGQLNAQDILTIDAGGAPFGGRIRIHTEPGSWASIDAVGVCAQ